MICSPFSFFSPPSATQHEARVRSQTVCRLERKLCLWQDDSFTVDLKLIRSKVWEYMCACGPKWRWRSGSGWPLWDPSYFPSPRSCHRLHPAGLPCRLRLFFLLNQLSPSDCLCCDWNHHTVAGSMISPRLNHLVLIYTNGGGSYCCEIIIENKHALALWASIALLLSVHILLLSSPLCGRNLSPLASTHQLVQSWRSICELAPSLFEMLWTFTCVMM